ncbi:MAG: hypothetical protein ACXWDB_07870, partial [Aeromicrobium sp.]
MGAHHLTRFAHVDFRSDERAFGIKDEDRLLHLYVIGKTEFDQFSFGYRADGTAPIQNKVGAFLADPLLDRILTAPEK